MTAYQYIPIDLERDCEATLIPGGQPLALKRGEHVVLTQSLGGSYTIQTETGYLARIAATDGDALGFDAAPEEEDNSTGPFDIENVYTQLRTVYDPEIPVNVVDLGLIYECEATELFDGSHLVSIKMSMTAPGCGMGDILKQDAIDRVRTVSGVSEVDVELVWYPPWDQSRMSEAAKLQLGMY